MRLLLMLSLPLELQMKPFHSIGFDLAIVPNKSLEGEKGKEEEREAKESGSRWLEMSFGSFPKPMERHIFGQGLTVKIH